MTAQPTTSPAQTPDIKNLAQAYADTDDLPITIHPDSGSRLADLHAAYPEAKAAADEAAARLKTITDGIKSELAQAAPEGTTKMELAGTAGPTLSLQYVTSWRLDTAKLKAHLDEQTLRAYSKQSGSWTLKATGGGR